MATSTFEDPRQATPNLRLARKLNIAAGVVSAVVLAVVVLMREISLPLGDFSFLPPFHSTVNALTAVVLIYSFLQIKKGNVKAHRNANVLALVLSVVFLLSYVLYHITTETVSYGGEGALRYLYFFLLISHIVLSAVILPFILFTFIRAYTNQIEKHKKMARWVFPLWLYVAVTGPICYLLLMPYYPS